MKFSVFKHHCKVRQLLADFGKFVPFTAKSKFTAKIDQIRPPPNKSKRKTGKIQWSMKTKVTQGVVYAWMSPLDNSWYVGQSTRHVLTRMAEHQTCLCGPSKTTKLQPWHKVLRAQNPNSHVWFPLGFFWQVSAWEMETIEYSILSAWCPPLNYPRVCSLLAPQPVKNGMKSAVKTHLVGSKHHVRRNFRSKCSHNDVGYDHMQQCSDMQWKCMH